MAFKFVVRSLENASSRDFRRRLRQTGLFDSKWYLDHNIDVSAASYEPIEHYLRHGRKENRSPGPAFDAKWYAQTYASDLRGLDACEHYLMFGQRQGLKIKACASDDAESKATPLSSSASSSSHYKMLVEKLDRSGLFDPDWYNEFNADVSAAKIDPLFHFTQFGSAELRNPGPDFDAAWYVEEYLLESTSIPDGPVFHYIDFGKDAGYATRAPSKYEDWYRRYQAFSDHDVICIKEDLRAKGKIEPILVCFADEDGATPKTLLASLADQSVGPASVWVVGAGRPVASTKSGAKTAAVAYIAAGDLHNRVIDADPDTIFIVVDRGVLLKSQTVALLCHACAVKNEPVLAYSDFEIGVPDEETDEAKPYFLSDHSSSLSKANPSRCFGFNKAFAAMLVETGSAGDRFSMLAQACFTQPGVRYTHLGFIGYGVDKFAATLPPDTRIALPSLPTISIIIPTKNNLDYIKSCVESIQNISDYGKDLFEIVIVDNNSTEAAVLDYLDAASRQANVRLLHFREAFNFSVMNNFAVAKTTGDILLFLNNDTVIIRPDWLKLLAAEAMKPHVGAVGAKLLFPDSTVQHGGIVIGVQGVAAHSHSLMAANDPGFQGLNLDTREVTAVTGACLAIRRSVFNEVGGFDADLQVAFNDVALCVSVQEHGYKNIWIDKALCYHFESKTRGYDLTEEKKAKFLIEAMIFNRLYWKKGSEDRCYNPNLSLETIYDLAEPPRHVRPWLFSAKSPRKRRVMLLSSTFQRGHGVAVVIALQAERLIQDGYEVFLGGPLAKREIAIEGAVRLNIAAPGMAARYAVRHNVDLVIAHTPPFYSLARVLGAYPALALYDYGEPPADLFPDRVARRAVNAEKALCFAMARFRSAISDAVAAENPEDDLAVLPLANSHLSEWTPALEAKRKSIRASFGWRDAFVILNVCRFHRAERNYKGVDEYVEAALRLRMMNQDKKVVIIMCGKGDESDIEELQSKGVAIFANVTDEEIKDLYLAADLYISLSKWEGYNLGIGQALALGVPTLASKIPAHDAFGVETFTYQAQLVTRANEYLRRLPAERVARVVPWSQSLTIFSDYVAACIDTTQREILARGRLTHVEGTTAREPVHGIPSVSAIRQD